MRLIDADSICFDELKNDFDRARAKTIIAGQPTIDFVTEERCYEIAREMIPQFVRQERVETVKEFAKRLKKEVNFIDTTRKLKKTIDNLANEMIGDAE